MKITLDKKILGGFIGTAIVLFIVAVYSFNNGKKFTVSTSWVEHTQKVHFQFEQVLVSSVDAETGVRGYAIAGTENYLEPFERSKIKIPAYIDSLKSMTLDNPVQQRNIDTLNRLIGESMQYLTTCIELRKTKSIDSARAWIRNGEGKHIEDSIRKVVANSQHIEDSLLALRKLKSKADARSFNLVFFILLGIITILLIAVYIIININIKALRKAEEEAADKNHLLEAKANELESFSYSISHDLKAPLRAVTSFSELLEDRYAGKLDEEGKKFLKIISENGIKMHNMIDKLLEFSRLGSQSIEKTEVDMESIVSKCLLEIKSFIPHHAAIRIHPLKPVKGDYLLLSHVWSNLLSNAIKYSAKVEAPQIDIGCIVKGDDIIYYVKDNGVGFDMAYVDKLFGVFHRLHSQLEYEGIGIGLATVQRIITKHGGRIWVESEPSKGATFYFSLSNK